MGSNELRKAAESEGWALKIRIFAHVINKIVLNKYEVKLHSQCSTAAFRLDKTS